MQPGDNLLPYLFSVLRGDSRLGRVGLWLLMMTMVVGGSVSARDTVCRG
jgi:hypothetical protein